MYYLVKKLRYFWGGLFCSDIKSFSDLKRKTKVYNHTIIISGITGYFVLHPSTTLRNKCRRLLHHQRCVERLGNQRMLLKSRLRGSPTSA